MTIYEEAIAKIRQMPEALVQEVNDIIDFLLLKKDDNALERWKQFNEDIALREAGMSDYLANLSDYEDSLARGEIQWWQ